MTTERLALYATTPKGMESLLCQELQSLGGSDVQESRGGVEFQGKLETAYRACLWSRLANRILLPLKTFPAADPDRLYHGVRGIHWTEHLTPNDTLAVEFVCSDSKITHSHFGALKVKDAIVDQFRAVAGSRPSVDPLQPSLRIYVYLYKDQATVSIDLSGESLHKRGYRTKSASQAPLKENLAAAILTWAGWSHSQTQWEAFIDPMCGSGTLPIEAAMMAARVAPGLGRTYFGFLGWQGHVPALWKRLKEEANDLIVRHPKRLPKIAGYDQDARAIRGALETLQSAPWAGKVHFEKKDLAQCEPIASKGLFVANPPYGERLGEVEELKPLYKALGDIMKQRFKGWTGYVFSGSPPLVKSIGLKAARSHRFFNGPIECKLLECVLY